MSLHAKIVGMLAEQRMTCAEVTARLPRFKPAQVRAALRTLRNQEKIIVVDEVRRPKVFNMVAVYGVPRAMTFAPSVVPRWLYPHVTVFSPALLGRPREIRVS